MHQEHQGRVALTLNYNKEEVDQMLTPPLDDKGETLESEMRGSVEQ